MALEEEVMCEERSEPIQYAPFHPTLTHQVKLYPHLNPCFFGVGIVLKLIFAVMSG